MRGHVRRRGNNSWAIVVDVGLDEHGRRRQKWHSGFRTRREAEDALPGILHRVSDGTYVEPSKITLREYLKEWLDGVQSTMRPSTRDSYARNIEQHVVPCLGDIKLQNLTAARLNSFYADMLDHGRLDGRGGLSSRSVRYLHVILRKALSDAVRWNRVARNVAERADPPRSRSPEMRTWTAQELGRFLQHVRDDDLYAAWVVAASTGMRRGEVLGLRWDSVDLDAGRISVRRSLVTIGYRMEVSEPKTASGRRTIALDQRTVGILRDHRRRQLEERLRAGVDYNDQDLVFARHDGTPIHPDGFSKMFGAHIKRAGLPRIRLHDLRHTHATLALQAGVHPKVVTERLGHASIGITLDTYSHVIPALQEQAAEIVAALIPGL